MKTFDRYVFKSLFFTTILIAVVLAVVVMLTQSLKFLELVINAGAGGLSFWVLTLLALPRFFEVILPLALLGAVLFIYNRMSMDSEVVVFRSGGYSAMKLARPALILACLVSIILWGITMWGAPKSLSSLNKMRQIIKTQISSYLLQEGVFNQLGKDMVVYAREQDMRGELQGLMIYDSRSSNENPATILAQRGTIVATDDGGHQVIVFDGSHQEFNPQTQTLQRLKFQRYTIDFPDSSPVKSSWSDPDERTITELLNPDLSVSRDVKYLRDFRLEIHRRIITPFLAIVFALIGCASLVVGPFSRRGQGKRILMAVVASGLIQSGVLTSYNIARQSDWGLWLLYAVIFVPLLVLIFFLSESGESVRRRFLYRYKRQSDVPSLNFSPENASGSASETEGIV